MKEMVMMLIAYNSSLRVACGDMIRLTILQAAARQGVSAKRISFIDAMRHAAVRLMGMTDVTTLLVNPHRLGRAQLRVIRRRVHHYPMLSRPRREEEKRAGKQGGNGYEWHSGQVH
jgi:hypothetical protein